MEKRLHRLRCSVKNYDWGRIGVQSGVARLFSHNSRLPIEGHRPYAEFWMGTHDSGPSFLQNGVENGGVTAKNDLSLKSWISQNPNVLGDEVVGKWGNNLPFMFKVLSVAKALSIQAHPDKKMAEVLHKLQPNVFKDDNHKPEMVLALTQFEALCGFISLKSKVQNSGIFFLLGIVSSLSTTFIIIISRHHHQPSSSSVNMTLKEQEEITRRHEQILQDQNIRMDGLTTEVQKLDTKLDNLTTMFEQFMNQQQKPPPQMPPEIEKTTESNLQNLGDVLIIPKSISDATDDGISNISDSTGDGISNIIVSTDGSISKITDPTDNAITNFSVSTDVGTPNIAVSTDDSSLNSQHQLGVEIYVFDPGLLGIDLNTKAIERIISGSTDESTLILSGPTDESTLNISAPKDDAADKIRHQVDVENHNFDPGPFTIDPKRKKFKRSISAPTDGIVPNSQHQFDVANHIFDPGPFGFDQKFRVLEETDKFYKLYPLSVQEIQCYRVFDMETWSNFMGRVRGRLPKLLASLFDGDPLKLVLQQKESRRKISSLRTSFLPRARG